MIREGKSTKTAQSMAAEVGSALESRIDDFERFEKEVVKWVKLNPLLGIGIALAIGVGMGWILKRRL